MRIPTSPFWVLVRTFLAQFFSSESVTSDILMRRAIISALAFLLTPCLYLMANVLPAFEIVRLVARARHAPEMVEQMLAQLALIFVTYSMVTTGLVTVYAWDALTFTRRDAMVLGPLPLRGTIVIAAKLAALATFMLATSLAINVTAGVPYAFVTGGNDGLIAMGRHLSGHLAGTIGGATFVFAAIVTIRGVLALVGGRRLAASAGSMLQFVFVSAVLCFFLVPMAMGTTRPVFLKPGSGEWIPTSWFFGLFEWLRGSPAPGLGVLAGRAMLAVSFSIVTAVLLTFAGFARQMQAALAPEAAAGALGMARMKRAAARAIVGRDAVARGVAEFILITMARNQAQQAPVAICMAIAVAVITIAISRGFTSLEALMHPRTIVLWIPMVLGYWMALGIRAAFFVPSELPAAWAFRANARVPLVSYWSAVRAAIIVTIVPAGLVATALTTAPLLGWRIALQHAGVVCVVLVLVAELVSLSIDFIPFTRPYQPGHAKLKTRWPLYLLAMFIVGWLPVQRELRLLSSPLGLTGFITSLMAAVAALEVVGRMTSHRWGVRQEEETFDDPDSATVLNITAFARRD